MRPRREQQALEEIGRTRIGTATAAVLVGLFALSIVGAPTVRTLAARTGREPQVTSPVEELGRLAAKLAEGLATARREGALAGNRVLLSGIESFEDGLEQGSLLRQRVLPPTQLVLTRWLGAGNEQAYVGRDGWLYYRPDVDHLTGPGFLDPDVLERRRRAGDSWERAAVPDPLPALERLRQDLAARGIELWLLPTPLKPALEPARLARRAPPPVPLRNPSWQEFRRRAEAAGLRLVDPASWLAEIAADEPLYLATDTHWTPVAMGAVAERLAVELAARLGPPGADAVTYFRRPVRVEGHGDIEVMLRLPQWQHLFGSQEVETETVLTGDGSAWRPTPGAAVLLLGDSFTNVYSEPGLGWGRGAGLAEQLAFRLGRPLDRIALNAGGSRASRQALLEALETEPGRLDGTRVVVYQFAARELSGGDWEVLPLPERRGP